MVTCDKSASYRDVDSKELERLISIRIGELALVSVMPESTCVSTLILLPIIEDVDMRRTLSTHLQEQLLVFMSMGIQASPRLNVSYKLSIRIQCYSAQILAVAGGNPSNKKTELLSVENDTWSTLDDYPFVWE